MPLYDRPAGPKHQNGRGKNNLTESGINQGSTAVTLNGPFWHARFSHNYIKNGLTGLRINNTSIDEMYKNTIESNWTGLRLFNSELHEFYRNVIEDCKARGIDIAFGSDAYLYDDWDEEEGRNRITCREDENEIQVASNSTLFMGDQFEGGYNAVFNDDPDELIANFNSSHTVKARYTYWGTTSAPSSSWFYGSVDYANHLTYNPTGGSGSPLAKTAGPPKEERPSINQRRETVLDLISEMNEDHYRTKNDHRLTDLYIYMRMDREDEMGLREQILSTIGKWSANRTKMFSKYGDDPQVRRAIETAMLLEIRLAFRDNDYDLAKERNDAYGAYIQTTENRTALLENEISIRIHHRDYAGALEVLAQLREQSKNEPYYDETGLRDMESYLTHQLGQTAQDIGSDKLADGPKPKIETNNETPGIFSLEANYPNPFNPVTVIPFSLPEQSHVRLAVYDILGRQVAVLTDQVFESGRHQVTWDGSRAASGLYIVRMMAGNHIQSRQIMLMK